MAINPITYTERVVKNFLRYQVTTYAFADDDLREQMRSLISIEEERRTPLLKGPYVSLSRAFTTGASVSDLVKRGMFHPHMANIITHPSLYGHQERAIESIHNGKPTLVSTGTGSGKTECYLYPIISDCLHLRDTQAPEGICAVIVYPMNALAEDQLLRMRELLSGSGITFGMYVGKTPEHKSGVTGQRLKKGSSRDDYRAAYEQSQKEKRDTAVHPPEERCSREEMREPGKQPRILLTNVKQMELLLTRQKDTELFEGALLRYLVFDEAHTYSGAQGAETACLIRRLRAFCGKGTKDTICIATSATIADREDPRPAREFASRFFGVDGNDVVVVSEEYESEQTWARERTMPKEPRGNPAELLAKVIDAINDTANTGEKIAAAADDLGGVQISSGNWTGDLYDRLASNELAYQIAMALQKPRPLAELVQEMTLKAGRNVAEEEILAWLALGAEARKDERPLVRPVVHSFLRGVGGAVVSFPEGRDRPRLHLSAAEDDASSQVPLIKLPILTCTTCGQHYFEHHVKDFVYVNKRPEGGDQVDSHVVWPSLDRTLGGKRLVLVDQIISAEEDDEEPDKATEIFFCRSCGALHSEDPGRCDSCGQGGPLVHLYAIKQKEKFPGYLNACISCNTGGKPFGSRYREPARPVRAVAVADVHILAQEMIQHAERKRLLVFADNRQDAAFQAGWMRDHARRYRLASLMLQYVDNAGVHIGDLVSSLDDHLDGDDDLSLSLAPEVWTAYSKKDTPKNHKDERWLFLRIQVLRELVTGMRRRQGLEAWGKIRVDYKDLRADDEFIVNLAASMGMEPGVARDAVAGLLDTFRRNVLLYDADTKIFSHFLRDDRIVERGYLAVVPPGVPKGLKLRRDDGDDKGRTVQWISRTGHNTLVREIMRKWGLPKDDFEEHAEALWRYLVTKELLTPVTLTGSKGNALPNCPGTYQLNGGKILIHPNSEVWLCRKCHRAYTRSTPRYFCPGWHCDGTLHAIDEDPDDYNITVLNGQYDMLRPQEHSAQVPQGKREAIENNFKGTTDGLNTLVCTPTLELGVDIGALDAVLMRNVPPLPANYWQRAGRAGRRHRMAVNFTYCRNVSHDRAYFEEPETLLNGKVDPPRFNLRNELMVAKHVHAAAITQLYRMAGAGSPLPRAEKERIIEALNIALPPQVRSYFFDDQGALLMVPSDISSFKVIIDQYLDDLLAHMEEVFTQNWPWDDQAVVQSDALKNHIESMYESLTVVIKRLKRRLEWAMGQINRLNAVRSQKGILDSSEEALLKRCDNLVRKFKGEARRAKREAQGFDDTNTYGVLAAEGFLPGYGLEIGTIMGSASIPPRIPGAMDFDLPRTPAVALREYIPGNLIYANGHKFVPRLYHLEPNEKNLSFQVDTASQSVIEISGTVPTAAMPASIGTEQIQAIPICDADLFHQSHISDEEEFRFQMASATYGMELDHHSGGKSFLWQKRSLHLLKALRMRLVNVGPLAFVDSGKPIGYPLCQVCGFSSSPFSSDAERQSFIDRHTQSCRKAPENIGIYADIIADALKLQDCQDVEEAYSLLEALRLGASKILDMDREDLQVLVIARPGTKVVDGILYDPMPGGSGLLEQICELRWHEILDAAMKTLEYCPGGCERSCIDCLHTFRNAFFHRHLDRHRAVKTIKDCGSSLTFVNNVPAKLPATKSDYGMTVNQAEDRLKHLLKKADFPEPEWKKQINLGKPLGTTTPDCYYPDPDDPGEPGACVYLDGLSNHIHGNPVTRQIDNQIRSQLRAMGYEVLEIPYTALDDKIFMAGIFSRIAKHLGDKDKAKQVRNDTTWFDGGTIVTDKTGDNAIDLQDLITIDHTSGKILVRLPGEMLIEEAGNKEIVSFKPVHENYRCAKGDVVIIKHPELKFGSKTIPIAAGKILQIQNQYDPVKKCGVELLVLRIAGGMVNLRLSEDAWKAFKPILILDK